MRKLKFINRKPRQLSNLLVTTLLSIVIALPILSQPLGLATTFQAPAVDAQDVQYSTSTELSSLVVETGAYNLNDVALNRSQAEYDGLEPAIPANDPAAAAALAAAAAAPSAAGAPSAASEPAETGDPAGTGDSSAPATAMVTQLEKSVIQKVDYPVYVKADVLNVRSEPSNDAQILSKLEMADEVQCVGKIGEWLKIEADDEYGYILGEYTSRKLVFAPDSDTVYVTADQLNLRETFSTDADVIVVLSHHAKLTRTGIGSGWSRVKTSSGKVGYVFSEYLTTKTPAASTSSDSSSSSGSSAPRNSSGNEIVDLAYKALGTPYVFGGESLSGMDCTGLVYWAYRQIGVTVPRSTSSYYNAGYGVSLSQARPGDIVCFDTHRYDGRTTISHVGIYIGGGMVIHASTSRHQVIIASVGALVSYGYKVVTIRRFPS
jgi:cell wall-associated NlpC family hydrolase